MLILDTTGKSLEVTLDSAVDTVQCPFVVAYVDINQSSFHVTAAASNDGATNDTTAVTAVSAPASGRSREVKTLTVANVDTAAVGVTLQLNHSSTLRTLWHGTLSIGDTLVYMDGQGFQVLDTQGRIKGTGSGGSSTTADIDLTLGVPTTGDLADGFATLRGATGDVTLYRNNSGVIEALVLGTPA